jgi:hypothetical protein
MRDVSAIDPLFDPNNTAPVAGRKCVERWDISTIFHNIFEIPTAAIAPLLPKGVEPVETRPGISLFDVGDVHWNSGNLDGTWPSFHELTAFIVVQPDLSVDMPMPKFAFYVTRIIANWHAFVKNDQRVLHLPIEHTPLELDKRNYPNTLRATDGKDLLFEFNNTHPDLPLLPSDFYGQYYSVQDGKLWFGIWRFEGLLCEHQKRGYPGKLGNHQLFFGDLDVERDCTESYMQLITPPGVNCIETFWEPWAIRNV